MLRVAIVSLLLWSAQASIPQDLRARAAACNRDNCYREVFGTAIPGRSASGASACAAYLQKTVSPCPVIQTSTTTQTVTVAKTSNFIIVTETTSTTSTVTPVTVVTDASSTSLTTVTPVITTTSTGTSTRLLTLISIITSTMSVNCLDSPYKLLKARATTPAACPATISAGSTGVPAYASDCTGTRFSSVCSCNGLSASTTTMSSTPTSTVTSTATASITFTSSFFQTTTLTNTILVTPTVTSTMVITIIQTITGPAITSSTTQTITTQSITTSTLTSTRTITCN